MAPYCHLRYCPSCVNRSHWVSRSQTLILPLNILDIVERLTNIDWFSSLIRRSFWDVHSGILGLVLALGLTVTFTDILKVCQPPTPFSTPLSFLYRSHNIDP